MERSAERETRGDIQLVVCNEAVLSKIGDGDLVSTYIHISRSIQKKKKKLERKVEEKKKNQLPILASKIQFLAAVSLEHLAEVLSEVMASRPLDGPPRARDVGLHRSRLVTARKLLRLRLHACPTIHHIMPYVMWC